MDLGSDNLVLQSKNRQKQFGHSPSKTKSESVSRSKMTMGSTLMTSPEEQIKNDNKSKRKLLQQVQRYFNLFSKFLIQVSILPISLQQLFRMKFVRAALLYLHLNFIILFCNEIGVKTALKMLVILSTCDTNPKTHFFPT
jgi:hypothetical protein